MSPATTLATRTASYTLAHVRAVTPEGILEDASIVVRDGRIESIGDVAHNGPVMDLGGALVLPGFIDLHVHGGGGASFNTSDPEEIQRAVDFHTGHGTTRMLASLVSESVKNTRAALDAITHTLDAHPGGGLLGAHLEGPFLSHQQPGCHDPQHLLAPDPGILDSLLQSCPPGTIRTMTIAPELPGADKVIADAQRAGIVLGIGHSAADFELAKASFRNGIQFVSHAFNAMKGIHHRHPGIMGAALADESIFIEIIVDGAHVHDAVVAMTFEAASGRVLLITDAAPAAGMPAGNLSHIGSAAVVNREDGRITRRDSDTLAGSSTTMDKAFQRSMQAGVSLVDASRAASLTPATVLGIENEYGALRPGFHADMLVLDDALTVKDVIRSGTLLRRTTLHARTENTRGNR